MCLKFLANLVGTLELFIRVESACFHTCAVIGAKNGIAMRAGEKGRHCLKK
jgi:hypothetical protein